MKRLFTLLLALGMSLSLLAQKGTSVLKSDEEITWLGMDFTQLRFVGSANQFKDAGTITEAEMRDKYYPGWNALFVNERKKYDVAKYVKRPSVAYEMASTEKANNASRGKVFTDDPDQYQLLTEDKVQKLVKGYNFQGVSGTGLMFFVEGMDKGKEQVSAWVTFVDTKSKTVIATKRVTGVAGGFGFRNFWAKGLYNILKNIPDHF